MLAVTHSQMHIPNSLKFHTHPSGHIFHLRDSSRTISPGIAQEWACYLHCTTLVDKWDTSAGPANEPLQ